MRPVTQTRFPIKDAAGDFIQRGDCLPACLATIFEIPIEDVPHFNTFGDMWWPWLLSWLNGRGFALWETHSPITYPVAPLCILSGKSPRDPSIFHAVVGRGDDVVHDPHPDGTGIEGDPTSYWYFLALDPSR